VARWLGWWNGLEVGEKDEGPTFGPFLKHAKEEEKKGAPAKVRWPLNEAGAGLFMRRGHVS
jgi:hypothetical protein